MHTSASYVIRAGHNPCPKAKSTKTARKTAMTLIEVSVSDRTGRKVNVKCE